MHDDIKNFILQKLNECILFTHEDYPKSIFHIWDKQLLRQKKLLRLSGSTDKIEFKPGQNSIILFKQDYERGYFCYSYSNLYQVLIDKFQCNNRHKQ